MLAYTEQFYTCPKNNFASAYNRTIHFFPCRFASMQDGAEKENKPSIIEEPIRNLKKSSDNKLWLIDNESGLFDAYTLLGPGDRFHTFHEQILKTMCVFQSSLVKSLKSLNSYETPHLRLLRFAQSHEPLLQGVEKDPSFNLFTTLFDERLKNVISWISHCQEIS